MQSPRLIIANDAAAPASSSWQRALRGAYTNIDDMVADGLALPLAAQTIRQVGTKQAMRIPREFAARFDRRDLARCPLYRQSVVGAAEVDPERLPAWAQACSMALYGRKLPWQGDPIGDIAKLAAPRLTHRYRHRALLHATSACALVCRYCFRKHVLSERTESLYDGSLAPAFAYVASHPEIEELVVTGGDPLTMSDEGWRRLLRQADAVPHLRLVRVHSRLPATLPERITPELIAIWAQARVQVVFAAHINHPAELSAEAWRAFARMRTAGIPLFHQAVLLAGINDDAAVLAELFHGLYRAGVRPFLLHHPDYALNTWGFRLGIDRGRSLMQQLLGRVSGPALPRYTLDLPGGHGKVDLMSFAVEKAEQFPSDDGVGGALWRVALPVTRATAGARPESDDALLRGGGPTAAGEHEHEPMARSVDYLDIWPTSLQH